MTDLLSVELKPPTFLSSVGPSRDGVLIPSDFGLHSFQIKKRSTHPSYQVPHLLQTDKSKNEGARVEFVEFKTVVELQNQKEDYQSETHWYPEFTEKIRTGKRDLDDRNSLKF